MQLFSYLFFLLVLIPSAILHEYMHGWVADKLGDPTARYAGRLTLDPRAHVDRFGTIILPLIFLVIGLATNHFFLFAYAKPVPYNPYNLRDQRWGPVWVALAGPLSNFFLAFVFGLALQFAPQTGSMTILFAIIVYANVVLAVFNLVPIPPLDGSKFLLAVLPPNMWQLKEALQRFGTFFLILFVLFFSDSIIPIIRFFVNLFTGGMGGL